MKVENLSIGTLSLKVWSPECLPSFHLSSVSKLSFDVFFPEFVAAPWGQWGQCWDPTSAWPRRYNCHRSRSRIFNLEPVTKP